MARTKSEIDACRSVDELVRLAHGFIDDAPPNVLCHFWTRLGELLGKPPQRTTRGGADWASMGRELDALLRHTMDDMDGFHPPLLGRVAQALASIVKGAADARGGGSDPQKRMLHDIFVRGRAPFWTQLVDQTAASVDHFKPKSLVSVAWALATVAGPLGRHGNGVDVSPFFRSLHETFDRRRGEFSSKHLGNLAWSYMTCRQDVPRLLEDFSAEFVQRRKREEAYWTSKDANLAAQDTLDPTTLCQWANAYAKAGHKDRDLFRSLAEAAVPLLWEFGARHFANLAYAFGLAGEVPRLEDGASFFDKLAAAAAPRAEAFDPQNMANVLWAYAKVEHDSPELIGAVARAAIPRLGKFDARQLANVAWALSKFPELAGEEVFDRIAEEVVSRGGSLDAFAPQGLAMLALSFATVGHASNAAFWECIERAVTTRCAELGPIECSQIAWSFAKVERRSDDVFHAIQRTSLSKISAIKPLGLSKLAWSFAMMGHGAPHFFEVIARASLQKLDEFMPHDKAMLALAYAQIDSPYPELFDRIAHDSLPQLGEFSGLDLFNIVMSYVKAGHASEPLMKAISTEIIRRPSHFPPELLVGIAYAYASVDCRIPALFYAIADECVKGCTQLDPKGIVSLAWSFATLDTFHSPLFGALADASEERWHAFDAPSLANMAWAYATAREDRPELFGRVANAAIDRKDEFGPQSISMILWACSDVGHCDHRLFESLAPVAAASLNECTGQGLATIAWAYSIADVDAQSLFGTQSAFVDVVTERLDDIDSRGLCQLHQWNLWRKEITGEPALPPDVGQLCYDAFVNQPTQQSSLQKGVISELVSMGFALEQEALTPSGYRLDALVNVDGRQVGVEVDGPYHFIGRRPTGSTVLKRHQVTNADKIPIVSLPYWELSELKTSDEKQEYLRLKLDGLE